MIVSCDSCGRDMTVSEKSYTKTPNAAHYCIRCTGRCVQVSERGSRKEKSTLIVGGGYIHEDNYSDESSPE